MCGRLRPGRIRMKRNLLVFAVTVVMTVTGLGSAASAAPGQSERRGGISFGVCDDPGLQEAGAECGYLSVPLDYDHSRGAQIQIAVSRVRHKVPDSKYQGIMLVNPGGPGGSGLSLATLGAAVPNNAGDAYDWIGF